jgi:acetoin utilization deacetylase AcuC-like enzyme
MINIFFSKEYKNHDTGNHPESIERIKVVNNLINEEYSKHNLIEPPFADKKIISLVHDLEYVNNIYDSIPNSGFTYFDPDTIASPNSLKSYLLAVGGSVDAVNYILDNKKKGVFFCAHRPPGHHAESNKAMGFGVFNNVAISAQYAQNSGIFKKILIVDFDVHHGNGTQHIFENNPNIYYASSHQFPFYPGTGSFNEIGVGNIFNCPLPSDCDSSSFKSLFRKNIVDKIDAVFDLIYFSAGFDAHKLDPLASINLEDDDFYWVTKIILEKFANNVPIISVLEGGYDMKGLYHGLNNHLKALVEYSDE